jgi:hypothetical protein
MKILIRTVGQVHDIFNYLRPKEPMRNDIQVQTLKNCQIKRVVTLTTQEN